MATSNSRIFAAAASKKGNTNSIFESIRLNDTRLRSRNCLCKLLDFQSETRASVVTCYAIVPGGIWFVSCRSDRFKTTNEPSYLRLALHSHSQVAYRRHDPLSILLAIIRRLILSMTYAFLFHRNRALSVDTSSFLSTVDRASNL